MIPTSHRNAVAPIERLSNDVLLELFKVVCDDNPLFLTPATRTQPAWQLPQVCRLWRSVAGLCKCIWNQPHFEFNQLSYGSEALEHILSQCAEYERRRKCQLSVSITVIAKGGFITSDIERYLYRWMLRNRTRVGDLSVQGIGAVEVLHRFAFTGPLPQLQCLRVQVARTNTLPEPEHDYNMLPFLMLAGCNLSRLECVSRCNFNGRPVYGQRITIADIPFFSSMRVYNHGLFSHIQSLRLVDCPQMLQYIGPASLTSLDFTCAMGRLSPEEDDPLLTALVGLIETSRMSLSTLKLHGWLPWNHGKLLRCIRNATNLRRVTIDFYVTLPMVGFWWTSRSSERHIQTVNACWEEVCSLPRINRLSLKCSIYCDQRVYKEVDPFRVYWVTKPLRLATRKLTSECQWKVCYRRADTWHGFRPDGLV